MIRRVTVTCASDDLIEIDGDIVDEYAADTRDEAAGHVALSDGTVLRVTYDADGIWRVSRVVAGSADYQHEPGDIEADTFDVATLTGCIRWVMHGDMLSLPGSET